MYWKYQCKEDKIGDQIFFDENLYQDHIHLLTYKIIRDTIHIPRKGMIKERKEHAYGRQECR